MEERTTYVGMDAHKKMINVAVLLGELAQGQQLRPPFVLSDAFPCAVKSA